jgi:hypothetical protein
MNAVSFSAARTMKRFLSQRLLFVNDHLRADAVHFDLRAHITFMKSARAKINAESI